MSMTPRRPEDEESTTKISFDESKEDKEGSDATSIASSDISLESLRSSVGHGVSGLSDVINDNLITVRYGAMASIGLLAAYGLAQSPLFFRYHTVKDLPSSLFRYRKSLPARLIRTVEPSGPGQPILCQVRHLSLVERVLPTSQYQWLMRMHPAAALGKSPEDSPSQVLVVQIAGIQTPPDYLSHDERPGEWLARLAQERTTISCQLLARRVREGNAPLDSNKPPTTESKKRPIPGYDDASGDKQLSTNASKHVAVAKVYYRPKTFQFFGTDLGEDMCRFGRANVSATGLYPHNANERVIDATSAVRDLARDAAYMDRLSRAEYESAKGSYGMWADSKVRSLRSDVVEEVDFQTKAPMWRKLWRWVHGG